MWVHKQRSLSVNLCSVTIKNLKYNQAKKQKLTGNKLKTIELKKNPNLSWDFISYSI